MSEARHVWPLCGYLRRAQFTFLSLALGLLLRLVAFERYEKSLLSFSSTENFLLAISFSKSHFSIVVFLAASFANVFLKDKGIRTLKFDRIYKYAYVFDFREIRFSRVRDIFHVNFVGGVDDNVSAVEAARRFSLDMKILTQHSFVISQPASVKKVCVGASARIHKSLCAMEAVLCICIKGQNHKWVLCRCFSQSVFIQSVCSLSASWLPAAH